MIIKDGFQYATKRSKNSKVIEYVVKTKKEKNKVTIENSNTLRLETKTNVYRYNNNKKELQIFLKADSSLVKGFRNDNTNFICAIKNVDIRKNDLLRFTK